jgi:hypothetical protein
MSRRVRRQARTVGFTALLGLVGLASAPANAAVVERESYAGTDTYTDTLCGIDVEGSVTFSGRVHFRVGKGKAASAFLLHDRFRFTETVTNPLTGRFYTVSGHGLSHETRATRIEGSIFEFDVLETGQFVFRDMAGRLVFRNRGAVRFTAIWDTLGDATPGGELLEINDPDIRGPHPSEDEGALCAAVERMIG